MDLARERFGVRDDDRTRGHEIDGFRIFPSIPGGLPGSARHRLLR
jgi:hypothetical protein